MSDRTQAIVIDGAKSNVLPVEKGVLKGSILGPLLFTLYINDICNTVRNCTYHFYADATVIYATARSHAQALLQLDCFISTKIYFTEF